MPTSTFMTASIDAHGPEAEADWAIGMQEHPSGTHPVHYPETNIKMKILHLRITHIEIEDRIGVLMNFLPIQQDVAISDASMDNFPLRYATMGNGNATVRGLYQGC